MYNKVVFKVSLVIAFLFIVTAVIPSTGINDQSNFFINKLNKISKK